jgi:hypothetical protein
MILTTQTLKIFNYPDVVCYGKVRLEQSEEERRRSQPEPSIGNSRRLDKPRQQR